MFLSSQCQVQEEASQTPSFNLLADDGLQTILTTWDSEDQERTLVLGLSRSVVCC